MLDIDKKQIANTLSKIIWDYKSGDNIVFNFKILFFLYKKFDESKNLEKSLLFKPMIAIIVSIIECVLYDLFRRLFGGTYDFPKNVDLKIKELTKDKKGGVKKIQLKDLIDFFQGTLSWERDLLSMMI